MSKLRLEISDSLVEALRDGEPCFFCLAFGMSLEDSLHYPADMQEGPITSDIKCPHCYDTEEEHGRLKLTPREKILAEFMLGQYRKISHKVLGSA